MSPLTRFVHVLALATYLGSTLALVAVFLPAVAVLDDPGRDEWQRPDEVVAGVRFKAWKPPSSLHPTIDVHAPLVFDLVDAWAGRALGGCTYHVVHPGGRSYDTFPVNANEAEARRQGRFWSHGHTPGSIRLADERPNPATPTTLDLRWQPVAAPAT